MARKKTITKDHILNAAYEIVATEGFSRFTARNIASKMKCSTQPIYLEFKNMDDLKNALFDKIEGYLHEEVFSQVITGEPIVDMTLNYVHFAAEEKVLYRSLYVEEHSGGTKLNKFSYDLFMEKISGDDKLKNLSQEKKEVLFSGTWVVATGLASLKSGGLINPSDEKIIDLMREVTRGIIENNDYTFIL